MSSGSAAKFGDASIKAYPVRSFIRGLNSAILSYYVRDDHIVEAKNVEVTFSGSLKPRLGLIRNDTAESDHFDDAVELRCGHRYNRGDGTRELVVQGSDKIYTNNNTTTFSGLTLPTTLSPADDGLVRFEQWLDVLYIASKNTQLMSYNKGQTPETRVATNSGLITINVFSFGLPNPGDSLDTSLTYIYRWTYERWHGDTFLSESPPLHQTTTWPLYEVASYGPGAAVNHYGSVEFKKPPFVWPTLDDDIKYINIYRTLGTLDDPIVYSNSEMYYNYYYLGRVAASDYTAAAASEVLFTDDGLVDVDTSKSVSYVQFAIPPNSKFIKTHKNRLWLANIKAGEYGDSGVDMESPYETAPYEISLLEKPSGVYYSEYNEPERFRLTSLFFININDGEPITAFERFENKFLIAFKSNSMWGIFGGDIENVPGIPDIEINAIEESVGCIAPQTLSYGEGGLIWLSNKGVYFYDGTRPEPMASEFIDPILANIEPGRKENATAIYTQNRKYILSFTDSTEDSTENTVSLEYDFITKTWTRKMFGNSTVYGINDFIEAKRGDEAGKVYALLATTDSTVGAVQLMDEVPYDLDEGIPWSFKTKSFDCGIPDVIKSFKTLIVRLKHTSNITVDYVINDGCKSGQLILVPRTCAGTNSHVWDEDDLNWQGSPIEDDTFLWLGDGSGGGPGAQQYYVINIAETDTPQANPIGTHIQFEFSGISSSEGQEIQGLTILYTPEMRVANA